MKIGVVGPTDRANVWDGYLRNSRMVDDILITSQIHHLKQVDACLLLDDSAKNLERTLNLLKEGIPVYLVATLPNDPETLRKVHSVSEEAGVPVQFSHWPTFSASIHWMQQQMTHPRWIHIERHLLSAQYIENLENFTGFWLDELALVLKWVDGGASKVSARSSVVQDNPVGILIQIQFERGVSASILISLTASQPRHTRIVSDGIQQLELDVLEQQVRSIRFSKGAHMSIQRHDFDASQTAELSLNRFLKTLQTGREKSFNAFDALQAAKVAREIQAQIS